MWSFSYIGRGCADTGEASVMDEITASSERQLKDTPERAHKHIRAAAEYVKAVARTTNQQVSIVAEGWVEDSGLAGTTVNVAIAAREAAAAEG